MFKHLLVATDGSKLECRRHQRFAVARPRREGHRVLRVTGLPFAALRRGRDLRPDEAKEQRGSVQEGGRSDSESHRSKAKAAGVEFDTAHSITEVPGRRLSRRRKSINATRS